MFEPRVCHGKSLQIHLPNVLWSLWTVCAVRRRSEGHTQDMSRASSFTDDIDLGPEESPLPAASDVAQWVSSFRDHIDQLINSD